jgi:hypothetical protein
MFTLKEIRFSDRFYESAYQIAGKTVDGKIFREICTVLENLSIVQYLRKSFDMKPSDGAEDESGQEMEQDHGGH